LPRLIKLSVAAAAISALALLALSPGSPLRTLIFNSLAKIDRPPLETKRPNLDILKIGHRGTTIFAPENTLPAFEKAIEMGLEYVEMDIRFTSDGVPVVIHDARVDRTTNGSGKVDELTLSEIRELDAGSWFSDEFIGTRVPTLEETLKLLQGRACIFWDTKARPNEATIELFRRYGFDRECLLISFGGLGYGGDPTTPKLIAGFWPYAPLVPVIKTQAELTETLNDFPNIRAVSIPRRRLSPELVDSAHAEGLLVATSTMGQADRALAYQSIIEAGVDIFMLDYIDSFYAYLENGNTDTPIPPAPKNAEYLPENWEKKQKANAADQEN